MSDPGPEPEPSNEETPGGLGRLVLRGASMGAIGYGSSQAINLVAYIVLARLLTPAEFGDFAAATVLIGFTLLLTETGMMSAIVQRRDRVDEAASTATLATFLAGLALALAMLAFSPILGSFFDNNRIRDVAAAMSGVILLRSMSAVPDALLWRRFSFARRLVIEPVQVLAFGSVSIYGAANGWGVYALVAGQYASHGLELTLAWIFARWRPRLSQISFSMWRELVDYGRHIFIATFVLRAGEQSDSIIIGRFLGSGALGQFRYAFRVAATPFLLIMAAASYVLFPAFSRISHDRERLVPAFERSLRWMLALSVPTGLVLIPMGESITTIVFGDIWAPAGFAAMAMAGYAGGSAVTSITSELLKAYGRPERLKTMHAITAASTVLAMLALAQINLTAAAGGLSIGACAGAAYAMVAAERVVGVPWRSMFSAMWPPVAASGLMVAVMTPIDRALLLPADRDLLLGAPILAAEGIACAVIYWLALIRLDHPTATDLRTTALGALNRLRGGSAAQPEPEAQT